MSRKVSIFRILLYALIIILSVGDTFAQGQLPDKPLIKYVSINPDNGFVKLEWNPSETPNIDSYILATIDISSLTAFYFDTVPGSQLSYTYEPFTNEALYYTVIAVDNLGTESIIGNDYHRPMQLQLRYDSCSSAMILEWESYVGWKNSLSGYRILAKNNQGDFERLERLDSTFNSFVHDGIEENQNYKYYIEAFNNRGFTSTSNGLEYYTYMPPPPSFINLDYVTVIDQRTAEITFSADISGEVNDFRVSRSSSINGVYNTIQNYLNVEIPTVHYIDNTIATSGERYFYKIEAINSCQEPIASTIPANNIVISRKKPIPGEDENTSVTLTWSAYEGFQNGLAEYRIYRKNQYDEHVLLDYIGANDTTYTEDVSLSINKSIKGEFSYFIEAHENGMNPLGMTGVSKSNEVIVNLESRIFMPNAFTPDGDNQNDYFIPIMDFIPKEYKFFIFDRTGKALYQTTDPNQGWDGSLSGSSKARQGVYVYHVEYLSYDGKRQKKTGNVTLIYPQ